MVKIPELSDVSDSLPALQKRRSELMAEAQRLRIERLELARTPEEWAAEPQNVPEVAALLGRAAAPKAPSKYEKLAEMGRQIELHEAAANLLEREIEVETNKSSVIIRDRLQPEINKRLRSVCLSLAKAQDEYGDLQEILDDLCMKGVVGVSSMLPSLPNVFGSHNAPYCTANVFLREAASAGVIEARELPGGALP